MLSAAGPRAGRVPPRLAVRGVGGLRRPAGLGQEGHFGHLRSKRWYLPRPVTPSARGDECTARS